MYVVPLSSALLSKFQSSRLALVVLERQVKGAVTFKDEFLRDGGKQGTANKMRTTLYRH